MNRDGKRLGLAAAILGCVLLAGGGLARAQLAGLSGPSAGNSNAPVTFLADQVSYDKTGNIVTAIGHVQAWQNSQTLYADKVVINRATGVAVATGNVILTEPGGQTVFANQATLSHGMKNAVMQGVAARLANNGKMVANGARRYNAKVDELVKVVYSACDLCKTDPTAPPLWQLRATSATRDLEHKRIEYRDVEMEIDGLPIFYTPFLSEPDPSVRRQTGLLFPSVGVSSHLGFFTAIPYYIVIGPSSDVTVTPIFASKEGPAIDAKYRRAFNAGQVTIDISAGQDRSRFGNSVFSNGSFDLNRDWRAGFSLNRASNPAYLNDFNILPNASILSSNVYLEGFAPGAYARIDADIYQGLVASVNQSELPIVLPHGQYDFESEQDAIGGRFSIDADVFNILRKLGTNTRRAAAGGGYAVPFIGPIGVVGRARVQLFAAAYSASRLYDQPNFSHLDSADSSRAVPFGAVFLRWPLARSVGRYGSQIIEPEVQLVTAPNIGSSQNFRIPNEDSLDLEFSDANLFSLNRYPGLDRIEGGSRVDYAMHAAWYLPRGALLDGIVGQSYRVHKDTDYLPDSGLTDNVSDIVGRITIEPSPFFNLTYRTRLSHADLGRRMIDATAYAGTSLLNFTGGYLYTNTNPYVLYDQPKPSAAYFTPRHEITLSAATNFGQWSLAAGTERNLQTGRFDEASFNGTWQNNCLGVSVIFYRRITSFNLDNGSTTLLLQFNFKTLGNVGFSAL